MDPRFFDDPLIRSNPNLFWGGALAGALAHFGLRHAVLSPGSRSAPLALAFARHPEIEAVPVLDERSAGFLALGLARQHGRPVVLACTSGTAGANYYPAVIEARYSQVPLLVLTADRPHELRECHSGQTIRQVGLFGSYARWEAELAYPAVDKDGLDGLLQTLKTAWERCLAGDGGAVHLNVPFRDPLHPTPEAEPVAPEVDLRVRLRQFGKPRPLAGGTGPVLPFTPEERGLIVAGPAQPKDPEAYARGVARLCAVTGWPVLAEALSPLRNHGDLNPYLISGYDALLRNREAADRLVPEGVVQLGSLPTSKVLRGWLEGRSAPTRLIDPSSDNRDPLQRPMEHLPARVESLVELEGPDRTADNRWLEAWTTAESRIRESLRDAFWGCDRMFEGKIPWMLASVLQEDAAVFIANSMPVRDAEYFWPVNSRRFRIGFNRGANGIDGTLSTAMGFAHGSGRHTVLLTGDLALLHDCNGLLFTPEFDGMLTILLVQNHGGAIFENLPISAFREDFTRYFLTPQAVDWQALLHAHGIPLLQAETWEAFSALLMEPPSRPGIRVVEVPTDPAHDVPFRRKLLADLSTYAP